MEVWVSPVAVLVAIHVGLPSRTQMTVDALESVTLMSSSVKTENDAVILITKLGKPHSTETSF